jgi:hypothetical protein
VKLADKDENVLSILRILDQNRATPNLPYLPQTTYIDAAYTAALAHCAYSIVRGARRFDATVITPSQHSTTPSCAALVQAPRCSSTPIA